MGKVAFLFAGQGAQYPGMGKELYEISPAAKKVFDSAETIRPGTIEQCFNGDMNELSITKNTQPCLFTVDYASAAALTEAGINAEASAGFSLGELAALGFCGILSFKEAFLLVLKRAELMQSAAKRHPGAMTAVLKLDTEDVRKLLNRYNSLFLVNLNCPFQNVVSGSTEQLDEFEKKVLEAGGRYVRLKVSGAFHSPFMEEASVALFDYAKSFEFKQANIPLYANATAAPYEGDLVKLMADQVKSPVLWQASIERMIQDGYDRFVEVGAGKTLSGLVKKIGGAEAILNVEDKKSLANTVEILKGESHA
ncbi:MAG: ACP S-malonyltransferase [Eubacteriales bacterium]